MNKFFVSLSIMLSLFFSACSSHTANILNKDEFYIKALQETKKNDIIINNEVISLFTGTYLNRVDDKYDDNFENFIISIYNVKNNPLPKIELNGQKYVELKKLDSHSLLIKSIPLKNSWANYYIVKFAKNDDATKLLLFKNQDNQEALLEF